MPLEFLLCGIINFLFCFNHIELGFLFNCTKSKITDTTSFIVLLKIVLLPYHRHPDCPCYIFIYLFTCSLAVSPLKYKLHETGNLVCSDACLEVLAHYKCPLILV